MLENLLKKRKFNRRPQTPVNLSCILNPFMLPHAILHTTPGDLLVIDEWFEHSIAYQERHGYPVWRHYDRNAIIKDIDQGNQYKIVIGGTPALVYSVAYADKVIWREMDQDQSMYLHRIVVNPAFKGQRLFGVVLNWSKRHIQERGLRSIRMDTWAANPTIIQYYESFGFVRVENFTTPDSAELPVHNRKLDLTLLEYNGQ
jgi:ribosomal protein S18 acetylase RimI-like enzyme